MAEDIQGLGALIRRIGQLATDTRKVEAPLKAVGAYMLGSIEKNFKEQGRPQKWKALAASTLRARRRGRGRGGPQILIDKGLMKNQVSFRVISTPGVEIGLNAVQARRQHSGYPGGAGRGHSKTPARSFLMFQDEDFREIGEIFKRHISRR
ncbi:MAG: hypothetical protein AUG51_17090 [Acidobacteria bacterium 13_1_20CM_3_53_8]|nr:MAG: hypothetical protein AUG51_17090 [Acidobacteria bacterium 13_1_20CM_3_53_8]